MKRSMITLLLVVLPAATSASADGPILVVNDEDGAAARVGAPVSIDVELATLLDATVAPDHLLLREQIDTPAQSNSPVPVQYVQESKGSKNGRLWWLMPPGREGQRRFQLIVGQQPTAPALALRPDRERKVVEVTEGPMPVLRYNQGTFNVNIVKSGYAHTLWLDYGGGRTCGMSEHILDLPYWALGLDFPTRISSFSSKRFINDNTDAPDTHEVTFEFPELTLTWSMSQVNSFGFNLHDVARYTQHGAEVDGVQRRLGYFLHGVEGAIYGNYSKYQVVPQTSTLADAEPPEEPIPPSPGHEREWLDCIRTRRQPSCNVEYAHKLNTGNMLANLSMKVGRELRFDPATETIIDDAEAAKLAQPEYRDPWKFPEEYK